MKVTTQMIEDLFNVFDGILDVVGKVPPDAKTLTKEQLAADVLRKVCDSLKTDIDKYFVGNGGPGLALGADRVATLQARARRIVEGAGTGSATSKFDELWNIVMPLLSLFEDAAKANLPQGSTPLDVLITVLDAIQAGGAELKADLPKLKTS